MEPPERNAPPNIVEETTRAREEAFRRIAGVRSAPLESEHATLGEEVAYALEAIMEYVDDVVAALTDAN